MTGNRVTNFFRNTEAVYSALCVGIAATLVFWPLLNTWLIMLMAIYWIFTRKYKPGKKDLRLIILFLLLFILPVIGFLYTSNTAEASFRLQQKTGLLVFPIVLGFSSVLNEKIYRRVFTTFVWCVVIGAVAGLGYGLIHYLQSGSAEDLHGHNVVVVIGSPPFVFGMLCLLTIMYLLNEMYNHSLSRRILMVYILVIAFLSLILLLLGTRNLLFVWGIVLVYFFFKRYRGLVPRLVFTGALILTFFAGITFNPTLHTQWKELIDFSANNTVPLDQDGSLGRTWGGKSIRTAIWKCSFDVIKRHPFTGVGTGDVQDSLQAAYESRKFYFASRYNRYNAHNEYVQETLALGIPGLLVFVCCLAIPLILYFNQPEYRLYCLFLFMFIVIGFSESVLELNKCIILYSFFNSIFAFTKTQKPST